MPKISINDIAAICEADVADVRAALKIIGKPIFGNAVFFRGAGEVSADLIREIESIRRMNAAQRLRQTAP